ncbi:MAG TPA: biotin/lipoyl-containing protein, partial [Acidimicrobiales bacterium]|nr:biotin/lipoyl-containing protein [Acidimicrobiales bacterium]
FGQGDIERRGHAIEARINAEDPTGGRFAPSPGTITGFRAPGGLGVRLDAGYEKGDTVSQFYDNLMAKLVVWGHDREAARRRLLRALGEMEVTGVATTIPAHVAILEHPDFIAGEHSTRWVEDRLDLSSVTAAGTLDAIAADPADDAEARVLREVTAEVDGRRYAVKLWVPEIPVAAAGVGGGARTVSKPAKARAAATGTGSGTVAVPMQGTIVKVLVAVGDAVEVGQSVCVLEAMKMENAVAAEKAGTVKEIRVSAGESVGPGDVVAIIE